MDIFRTILQITDAYCERLGLPAPEPENPQERALAHKLLDEAEWLLDDEFHHETRERPDRLTPDQVLDDPKRGQGDRR